MDELGRLLADIASHAKNVKITGTNADADAQAIMDMIETFDSDKYIAEACDTAIVEATPDIVSDWRDEIMGPIIRQIERIHEAICEGRKQDAIDILNDEFPTGYTLRSATTQNSLFPDRVQS